MKLTKTLRMHIDTFFNKISPEDLHTISKEKYSFEELGKILEDDRVSFSTAQMLKDVKFPITKGDLGYFCVLNDANPSWSTTPEEIYTIANYIPAPTLSIAKKWFRKSYKIHIIVNPTITDNWTFALCNIGNEHINLRGKIVYDKHDYVSYEDALEQAIVSAIKLISKYVYS